jgi:hypothetical protein
MKKPLAKQIIMGAMALTLVGGSGALISQNAFAATPTASVASTAPATSVAPQKNNQDNHSWEGLRVSDQLLTFLKLDKTTFKTKSATETLAQIATDQGISRDALKAELTTEFNAKLDKEKADFATNIDKTVDSIQKGENGRHGGGKHGGDRIDLTPVATALGYATVAELKTALVSGTSIADLATAKGVTVQSLIDLQTTQIVKNLDQELANKKITQAQYDKQKANSTNMATKIVNNKHDNKGEKKQDNNQNDKEVNDDATTVPTAAPSTN